MFNVGGGEILVILLLALIVLGPDKLPNAAKQVGKVLGEVRRMSNGFQQELRDAMDVVTDLPNAAMGGAGPSLPPRSDAAPAATPATAATSTPDASGTAAGGAAPDGPGAGSVAPSPAGVDVEGPTGSFS